MAITYRHDFDPLLMSIEASLAARTAERRRVHEVEGRQRTQTQQRIGDSIGAGVESIANAIGKVSLAKFDAANKQKLVETQNASREAMAAERNKAIRDNVFMRIYGAPEDELRAAAGEQPFNEFLEQYQSERRVQAVLDNQKAFYESMGGVYAVPPERIPEIEAKQKEIAAAAGASDLDFKERAEAVERLGQDLEKLKQPVWHIPEPTAQQRFNDMTVDIEGKGLFPIEMRAGVMRVGNPLVDYTKQEVEQAKLIIKQQEEARKKQEKLAKEIEDQKDKDIAEATKQLVADAKKSNQGAPKAEEIAERARLIAERREAAKAIAEGKAVEPTPEEMMYGMPPGYLSGRGFFTETPTQQKQIPLANDAPQVQEASVALEGLAKQYGLDTRTWPQDVKRQAAPYAAIAIEQLQTELQGKSLTKEDKDLIARLVHLIDSQ